MVCVQSQISSDGSPSFLFLSATMVAVGEVGLSVVPKAAQLTRSQRVLVQQDPARSGEIQSEGRSVARPRPGTAMELAVKWRQLTVRALLLCKDALLTTVMVQLKSFELSAEVLAESGLLILLGPDSRGSRQVLTWRETFSWRSGRRSCPRLIPMTPSGCRNARFPPSEGCHSMTPSKW